MLSVRNVRSDGHTDFTYDVACAQCGEDDPTTERRRPVDSQRQWLCGGCDSEMFPRNLSPKRQPASEPKEE